MEESSAASLKVHILPVITFMCMVCRFELFRENDMCMFVINPSCVLLNTAMFCLPQTLRNARVKTCVEPHMDMYAHVLNEARNLHSGGGALHSPRQMGDAHHSKPFYVK